MNTLCAHTRGGRVGEPRLSPQPERSRQPPDTSPVKLLSGRVTGIMASALFSEIFSTFGPECATDAPCGSCEWWMIGDPAFFLLLWRGSDLKATKYCSEARFPHVDLRRDLLLVGLTCSSTRRLPDHEESHPTLEPEPEPIVKLL